MKTRKIKRNKTEKKFLFNPNNPNKSFDVYVDKNPKDTIPIKYTTVTDVKNTIHTLEQLYKSKKYSHKRIWQSKRRNRRFLLFDYDLINLTKKNALHFFFVKFIRWQVGMILYVRLKVLKEIKPAEYELALHYFKFLKHRTSLPEDERYKLTYTAKY